ncbi:MAG: arylesterase [Desulfuromonadales bacterium]|uniref:arylesterase n=1 Tax=Desulfuromonas sp. KJ2020 TaxID=2919173 RepID=UPI0020A75838|nr:arylesterase [Desulfuromonas sp. KJ2020]MCP3176703.1 arylesterase [Desulfuromonas sp. KJ2020]
MFRLLHFLAIALFLLLAGGCDRGPAIAPLPEDAIVLAFGDSLTYGTGAGSGESYPEVLAALLGRTVINAGVPGETSAQGLRRLPDVLAEYEPDLVILCHGGNDFLRRLDRQQLAANLEAMVALIHDSGAEVVVVGVPQFGLLLKTAPLYDQLAETYHLPYEGDIITDLLGDRDLKSDTVHPNAAGYRQLAEALFRLIDRAQRS